MASIIHIRTCDDLPALAATRPAGALVWLPVEHKSGEELFDLAIELHPGLPVAFFRSAGTASEAVSLLRRGAAEYFDMEHEALAWNPLGSAVPAFDEPWRNSLIGSSRAMQKVFDTIRLLGPRRSTVLIQGETGTGKEMVAKALHLASPRAANALVAVNCTALPDSLLEAELFGHTKGAFTGAVQGRQGRFEQAQRGTIFLDEIGDLPVETQAKLLRVLQEKELQRLGSGDTVQLDVRVVAATNVDLESKIEHGKFREDLYYRLNVVPVELPPLRARTSDIPELVQHFVEKVCRNEGLPAKVIYREAMELLLEYSWPGNVRQLENTVERAVILSGDREQLNAGDFRLPRSEQAIRLMESAPAAVSVPEQGLDLQQTVNRLERTLIDQALRRTGGNKSAAADILGLKRTTLTAKIRVLEAAAG